MSGPWEDFQPKAAPAPAAAPPAAPAATDAPWQDYSAPAPAPTLPKERPAARGPEELQSGVLDMLNSRAPLSDIRDYVRRSGGSIPEDMQQWLDKNYEKYTAPGTPKQHWTVRAKRQADPVTLLGSEALGSGWAGLRSGALRGYDDEWAALWGAIGSKLNHPNDVNFGDAYDILLKQQRAYKDRAYNQNMLAYGAGYVPGMVMGPSYFRGPAASTAGRVGQAAGTGAIEGALVGSGNAEGGLADRASGAGWGGTIGSLAGVASYPLGLLANSVIGRMVDRVGSSRFGRNSLNSGLDALARRAPQSGEDMAARAAEFSDAGIPPRPLDVVDESGKGVIRDAASKTTPAREELAQHANDVYLNTQNKVAEQARKNISSNPTTARQLADKIQAERDNLGPEFRAAASDPVPLTPAITDVLRTREGMAALRAAEGLMKPGEREQIRGLMAAIRKADKMGTPEEQARKLFPGFDNLSPDAQQQMIKQLDIKDPFADVKFNVDIADKFARAIGYSPTRAPGLARVAGDLAKTVRDAARTASKGYDKALTESADLARVGEAAGGTGRYQNTDFMATPADQYGKAASEASRTGQPVDGTYPSEYSAMRDRARDQVVEQATSGSGNRAMGVARQMSRGEGQAERNRALLGEDQANKFESGMRAVVKREENTRYVDPRTGSQTAGRMGDATDEGLNFVADAATSGKWGAVRGLARWLRGNNIRNVDAERLVRDAIDPARTQDAIDYLVKRGVKVERARSVIRSITATVAGRTSGAMVGTEKRPEPPNSVRMLLKEPQR